MLTKVENTYAYCNNTEAASGSNSMDKTAAGSQTESGSKTNRRTAEYSRILQKKYSYMNTGTTSMGGIPTTVSVLPAFLQKCANDPEKAKYLEENESGNITAMSGCTNDPDGKIARENVGRRAKEKKEQEEKQAERRAAFEKLGEESAEGEIFTVSADGADVRSVTQRLMSASLGMPTSAVSGFSARA